MLSVDEAVQEFGLPFSPQKLWAEVQAGRVKLAAKTNLTTRSGVWSKSRKRTAGLTLAAALLASLSTYALQAGSLAIEVSKYPSHCVTLAGVARHEIVHESTPHGIRLCTLAEVPDGTVVIVNANTLFMDNSEVNQNIQDSTPEWLPVADAGPPSVWRVVRQDGRLYVHGWAVYDVSDSAASLSGITLYSTPTALGGDHRMLPFALRATRGASGILNMMTSRAAGAGWESTHFDWVRLDRHAKDA